MHFVFYAPNRFGSALGDRNAADARPLGGAETALVNLVAGLRSLGHRVELAITEAELQDLRCDAFVSLRHYELFRRLRPPGRVNYLWSRDIEPATIFAGLNDLVRAQEIYDRFTRIVCPSWWTLEVWTREHFLHLDHGTVIPDGVRPPTIDPEEPFEARPPRVYYAGVPWKGMHLLPEAWIWLKALVPEAELRVFGSGQLYGGPPQTWEADLVAELRKLPDVQYHGLVNRPIIRRTAARCRVFVYPCETAAGGCNAVLEAMASGCAVVGTYLGQLPELAAGNPLVPLSHGWFHTWYREVARLLRDHEAYRALAQHNLLVARERSQEQIAGAWCRMAEADLAQAGCEVAPGQGPLVSVITPTLNRAAFLGPAIESVLQQEYGNWELILVDDGSTDGSLAIMEQYAARDPRIRVHANGRTLGISRSRNVAIRLSRGAYIGILDSDDLLVPRTLTESVRFLQAHPELKMCFSNFFYLREDQSVARGYAPPFLSAEVYRVRPSLGHFQLFDRRVFDEIGYYNEQLVIAEDTDLQRRIVERFPIARLDQYLYFYRLHRQQIAGFDEKI